MTRWLVPINTAFLFMLAAGCDGPTGPHTGVTDTRALNVDNMELRQGADLDTRMFPGMPSLTQQAVVVIPYKMNNQWYAFGALIGENSQGSIERTSGTFVLKQGWVYVCGQAPQVFHDGSAVDVTAGAEGSSIAMELSGGTRRIYFFSGTKAWVRVGTGSPQYWTDKNTYVEVTDTATSVANFKTLPSVTAGGVRDTYEYIRAFGGVTLLGS